MLNKTTYQDKGIQEVILNKDEKNKLGIKVKNIKNVSKNGLGYIVTLLLVMAISTYICIIYNYRILLYIYIPINSHLYLEKTAYCYDSKL